MRPSAKYVAYEVNAMTLTGERLRPGCSIVQL